MVSLKGREFRKKLKIVPQRLQIWENSLSNSLSKGRDFDNILGKFG